MISVQKEKLLIMQAENLKSSRTAAKEAQKALNAMKSLERSLINKGLLKCVKLGNTIIQTTNKLEESPMLAYAISNSKYKYNDVEEADCYRNTNPTFGEDY